MLVANTEQIRAADQQMIESKGFPSLLLMETAGRKAAEYILQHFGQFDHYLILVGPGNNGGDGLVIARYLHWSQKSVSLLLSHPPSAFKGDALVQWQALEANPVVWEQWQPSLNPEPKAHTLLVDALLGTGISSALRGTPAEIIQHFGQWQLPCVAVDLPSGLNADSGGVHNPCLKALCTITFQLPKICHFTTPASLACGRIVVVDIGISVAVIEGLGIRRRLTTGAALSVLSRPSDGHKGTFGHALLAGGSREMPGAIALSAKAALHIGAGLSTAAIPGGAANGLWQQCIPEIMAQTFGNADTPFFSMEAAEWLDRIALQKKAIALGPGMGQTAPTADFLEAYLTHRKNLLPTLLDADALNILASRPQLWNYLSPDTILTPHPGEMKRLTGRDDLQDRRLEAAEELAQTRQVIVILKGQGTIIALPDGQTWINTTGNAGMGTAGAGDVLSGTIAGLLAQGIAPAFAAPMGVFIHGLAGDLAAEQYGLAGVTATRISENLGNALHLMQEGRAPQTLQI